jgi:hypothetical protein
MVRLAALGLASLHELLDVADVAKVVGAFP